MSLKSELCLGDGHLSLDAHMGLDQGADLAVQPCQEKEVDEQITKIYSQVMQACFIPFEESSVTEKKRLTTNIKEKWRFNIFPKKENISAILMSGDYFHNL